jgi:hypothetical protein
VPPSLTTQPAGGAGTGARLVGTVNPQGTDAQAHFEWGATAAYGNVTPAQDIGSGTATATVTAAISALVPGNTYHYRLDATGDGGTHFGTDRTFKVPTPATPAMWVANQIGSTLTEFGPGAWGNIAPIARLSGTNTKIHGPFGVALDGAGNLFATSDSTNSFEEYAAGATGNMAPITRVIGTNTDMHGPTGIAIGPRGKVYVANSK